jgi:fumarate hydratase subunit alpha
MRTIPFDKVVSAVERLAIEAAHKLPADVITAIEGAIKNETSDRAKKILEQLLENAKIASTEQIPLCQDTGVAVVFVEQGMNVSFGPPADNPNATLTDAINAGIAAGYKNGYLRKSMVAEPLQGRKNTGTNTPAIIHYQPVSGDKIKITLMAKGGGCENKSQFKMFKPTADIKEVGAWIVEVVKNAGADACPPFVVGVGLGGNFETACLLAKKALLRPLDAHNSENFYADIEKDLLGKINQLGIGPQGLGGRTTALGIAIETAPCHIASLPAAVNIECHAHRHTTIIL